MGGTLSEGVTAGNRPPVLTGAISASGAKHSITAAGSS